MSSLTSLFLLQPHLPFRFFLYDIFIDKFRIVDKKPSHFLLEKLNAANISIIFFSKRRLIAEVRAFAVVRLKLMLGGGYVVLCVVIFAFDLLFHSNFHIEHYKEINFNWTYHKMLQATKRKHLDNLALFT